MMEMGNLLIRITSVSLLLYQYKYKKNRRGGCRDFSVTDKMRELAIKYGLPYEITKIGFKYTGNCRRLRDVLVGGEESGGLVVKDIFQKETESG